MNDAEKEEFNRRFGKCSQAIRIDRLIGWVACREWRDSQNTLWRNAAIRVGEDLHSVGPNGYYNMSAEEWLNWALNTIYSKPNFAPPSAQINQQLLDALHRVLPLVDFEQAEKVRSAIKTLKSIQKEDKNGL